MRQRAVGDRIRGAKRERIAAEAIVFVKMVSLWKNVYTVSFLSNISSDSKPLHIWSSIQAFDLLLVLMLEAAHGSEQLNKKTS